MSEDRESVEYLRSLPYAIYVLTPHWIRIREEVRAQSGGKCADCGKTVESLKDLDAHHVTYKNRGREEPGDVIAICRPCHQKRHPSKVDTRLTREQWARFHEEGRIADAEAAYEEREWRETYVLEEPHEWWRRQMEEWPDN